MINYDVAVVGGGPGGYVAAIRAAKLGCSVALVEMNELGGTCLNRGCIPSKTLLRHAEVIENIRKAKNWGIETGEIAFSFDKMIERKNQVIKRLRTGIASLLKAGKIQHYQGLGTVHADRTIRVQSDSAKEEIKAGNVILATGSVPVIPPIAGLDHVNIHTSDTIFDIRNIPKSIVIIGGGIIGVEFACIFQSLNVDVTIVEMADRIVPSEDPDASVVLDKTLRKKGVHILTNTKVKEVREVEREKQVIVETAEGKETVLTSELVLVAVGRKPNFSGIINLGLKQNGDYIAVNNRMETSIPNIYAVGDLTGGWQLAHVASAEGLVAAANASGLNEEIDYRVIPRCVYTYPEIASVGLTEAEAVEKGYSVRVEKYQHIANGKALALDEREGFVKIIAEERYGEILGVVMVGPHVTEMISEASAFMYLEGTVEELAKMIHPHPTVSESLFEVAAAWLGRGVHS